MKPLCDKLEFGVPQDFDIAHHHLAKLLGLVSADSEMRHFKGMYWTNDGNVLTDIFKVLIQNGLVGYDEDELQYQWIGVPWISPMYDAEKAVKRTRNRGSYWMSSKVKFGMTAASVRALHADMSIEDEVPDEAILKRGPAASFFWEWSE